MSKRRAEREEGELSLTVNNLYRRNTEQLTGPKQGRGNRNSKFRADCWDQEKVMEEGEGEGEREVAADTPSSRQKRARGRRQEGPCLWETSYYLGED